jgi:guanine deaminase
MNQARFMRRAIALSCEQAQAGGGPFGAVIVHGNAIIAEGCNQVTSANDPTAHAEIVAIRAACARLNRFELSGCAIFSSCEPCPMCFAAIYWARLDHLYYAGDRNDAANVGFDDVRLYTELALPIAARQLPTTRLLANEARAAFEAWARNPNRVAY